MAHPPGCLIAPLKVYLEPDGAYVVSERKPSKKGVLDLRLYRGYATLGHAKDAAEYIWRQQYGPYDTVPQAFSGGGVVNDNDFRDLDAIQTGLLVLGITLVCSAVLYLILHYLFEYIP